MTTDRRPTGQSETALADWNAGRTVSELVVAALAAAEGVEPMELGCPLNDSVDPDALDGLFATRHDGAERPGDGSVEFASNGYRVVVEKSGGVRVDPAVERVD